MTDWESNRLLHNPVPSSISFSGQECVDRLAGRSVKEGFCRRHPTFQRNVSPTSWLA